MDNKYKLLIGGTLATAAVGGVLYLLNEKKKQQNEAKVKEISRTVVYNILKELQREFYTCFTSLAMVAIQIQSQNRNKFQSSELKEILMSQPHLTQEIDEIEKKVYSKHNISRADFEYACTVTYKNDKELLDLQADMKSSLEKACVGVAPDSKAEIPDFLTPERTLEILQKIMKSSASRIHQAFQDLKNQGEDINLNNPQVLVTLNNLKLDDIKKDILIEAGLDKFDDPATKILQFATQKYQRENSNSFGDKYKSLELKHQKTVEHLFKNPDVPDDFVEKSFSEEDQLNTNQNFLSNFINAKPVAPVKTEVPKVEQENKSVEKEANSVQEEESPLKEDKIEEAPKEDEKEKDEASS